jgi:hypothetical protein
VYFTVEDLSSVVHSSVVNTEKCNANHNFLLADSLGHFVRNCMGTSVYTAVLNGLLIDLKYRCPFISLWLISRRCQRLRQQSAGQEADVE